MTLCKDLLDTVGISYEQKGCSSEMQQAKNGEWRPGGFNVGTHGKDGSFRCINCQYRIEFSNSVEKITVFYVDEYVDYSDPDIPFSVESTLNGEPFKTIILQK